MNTAAEIAEIPGPKLDLHTAIRFHELCLNVNRAYTFNGTAKIFAMGWPGRGTSINERRVTFEDLRHWR